MKNLISRSEINLFKIGMSEMLDGHFDNNANDQVFENLHTIGTIGHYQKEQDDRAEKIAENVGENAYTNLASSMNIEKLNIFVVGEKTAKRFEEEKNKKVDEKLKAFSNLATALVSEIKLSEKPIHEIIDGLKSTADYHAINDVHKYGQYKKTNLQPTQ